MQIFQQYVSVSRAKTVFPELVRTVKDSDDAIAITENGVPEAVLISMDKFQGLLETLEILSDKKTMESLQRSVRDAADGKWLDYDEVFSE